MYIHAATAMLVSPQEDLTARRKHLARDGIPLPRRLGRFGLLALLGAHELVGEGKLPPTTGVYLATESGAAGDTEAVLEQVVAAEGLPKPVNFIHTLSNTAAFYVARQYGLEGPNQTISSRVLSFERTLDLAHSDLRCHRATHALIGAVDETSLPETPTAPEASCWLLASLCAMGADGRIVARIETRSPEEARSQMERLAAPPPDLLSFGPLLTPAEKARWCRCFAAEMLREELGGTTAGNATVAVCLCRFLKGKLAKRGLLLVNRDFTGRCSLILLQRSHPRI